MCQKEKAWPKKGKINASAKGTHVENTATRVSKKTRNDEKGTESLAETMDPRGAIQPQTLVGPDEEAEQLTMSFRNLVPELRGFETFGIAECQDAPMERQTWPSRESHSWQPGVTADSGNYFDFRHKSTLKELAKRWTTWIRKEES